MSRWPLLAPRTFNNTDTKNAERSHSANLYNRSKFAIFNDRSQLDFYYYSLIPAIILGAAGLCFHWSIITTEEIALFLPGLKCENRFECPPGLCMYGLSQL